MDSLELLQKVAAGRLSPEEAVALLNADREADLGFARLDLHRLRRCGLPEVVFGEGKSLDQIVEIVKTLQERQHPVLVTRIDAEQGSRLLEAFPGGEYHDLARSFTLEPAERAPAIGRVGVVTAGTSDLPVAEEACLSAAHLGARVERIYDVGVAGLHRLVSRMDTLRACRVLVVVAGMEGALPSVVGGLTDQPLIAVPTSVGYGTNFQGLSALLAMLNSCVPGISVVNIDNGFGAGVSAALINRLGEPA